MTKKEVKLQIAKLVERYDRILKAGKAKSYNEAQTRNEFIEPFFESLGWDMRNQTTDNEVTTEESVSGGRIDLAFRLNNIPSMFLEAKPLKADLNVESYSRQAINYAWNKGVNYAVLSDFENIKVYNAQAESKSLLDKLIFEIPYTEYISDFERLWLLSKESFSRGALDDYAQKYGKMKKSLTVNEKLFGDLKEAREILTKAFRWNEKLTNKELEEGVQRILDRLVFIRVLEDRKLEPPILKEVLRIWERDKSKQFFPLLAHKFRELDDLYNSSLFKEHACEHWEEYDQDTFKKVIRLLYGREDIYAYDFKQIPSDILGGVYESYLSYIAQSKKIDKKEVKVKSRQKRKEQGIFYTPRYIVDFIVKNTLEERLKECQSITELKKVKVLDPACGSGSFLVKALEAINNKYKEFGNPGKQFTKSEILLSNIYGVDLDPQAIELAKLNLLIEALDEKAKLPDITPHLCVGNSLVSGTQEELEKYFGKDWREQKPFNFEEEFQEVFKQGGFDVIIGNPPYIMVENLQLKEREYMMSKFKTAQKRFDIYIGFIEKAITLLKKGGLLGFIIPYQFLTQDYAEKIRSLILKECAIKQIVDLSQQKVFQQATVRNIILIIKKGKYKAKTKIIHSAQSNVYTGFEIDQELFEKIPEKKFRTNINENNLLVLDKITSQSINLGKIAIASWGARGVPKEKFQLDTPCNKLCKRMVKGKNISRYNIQYSGKWLLYDIKKLYRPSFPELFENEKLLFRGIVDKKGMVITYDNNKYYTDHSLNCLILKHNLKDKDASFFGQRKININLENITLSEKFNIKFLLGILNSKLINFYFKLYFSDELHVYPETIEQVPIPKIPESQQQIIEFVDGMLNLNKELQATSPNTDKYDKIKQEINKIDHKINEAVYKLYNLSEKEIRIIEQEG